jgi:hypothetical protein
MVSVPETLFIGLVTYPGTRFPDAAGKTGLMSMLTSHLSEHGVSVTTEIAAEDAYEAAVLPINSTTISESIEAELAVETAWHEFLGEGRISLSRKIQMPLRRRARRKKYLDASQAELSTTSPGVKMVRRLINIELAHMKLLRAAVASDSDWTLIIEDDAAARNLDELTASLTSLMSSRGSAAPKYVNVSESFSAKELGIEALLTPVSSWNQQHSNAPAFSSRLPVTNTVCAILYRRDFLVTLLDAMEAIPTEPVIPIDWKLNQALMNLTAQGAISPGDCWSMFPAPIIQRSMVNVP